MAEGRHLQRVELEGPKRPVIGKGLAPVYVVGLDKREALSWAQRNKRGFAPKFCHAESTTVMQGLYLKDEPVYVLNPMPQSVREAWARTGAKLVYL